MSQTNSFMPGKPWYDTNEVLIQAHGGQVQQIKVWNKETQAQEDIWWWVGEDKTKGYRGGICAYSSKDLYNWTFEGIVMRNISRREQLDTEQYFTSLYKEYTKEQLDNVFLSINDTTSVIERPKMIYNEITKKYVIWFHADGPTTTSNANYAAASTGVAISDSPSGPFRFIDRYRLHTCPADQEDMYPSSRGMARDMNLYIDDDNRAYIIYASEENLTLYISRLNEEYTYLDRSPEEAVYGIDYVRVFPGAQREAPAIFKRQGLYYLITSGCTGWAPNPSRYAVSSSLFGPWEDLGDPFIEDTKRTSFDSQSTCVIEVNGSYIYMGDRWLSNDLTNSSYIWLPIQFNGERELSIEWNDKWNL